MAYISQNPYTGETLAFYDTLSDSDLNNKVSLAKTTFQKWRLVSYQKKAKLLLKLADLLEERKEVYGKLITTEMGKPISQSIAEVEKCAWVCRYYAENAAEMLKGRITETSDGNSRVCFHPIGGILAVMPWNFPFWQVFRQLAPTLMTGNVGFFKHASNVPQCAIAIEQLLIDAGIPKGVFQNIFANYKQIEQLIATPLIQAITLTGSEKAGRHLASIAGKNLKKSLLELGGSDPFIVFDDADMAAALENALLSRFINNGQSCIAAKRFIVHESISQDFVTNYKSLVENIPCGDPMDKNSFVGCLVDENAVLTIERQVKKSIKMGAECIIGGTRDAKNSCFYEPTIIINPPIDSPVWSEEVFGPVAPIVTFKTDNEALAIANDSRFGLGASVWTDNMERAEFFAEFLEAGIVTINGMVKSEPGLPFGGIKDSGYGRELDLYGIHEFVNIKTVSFKD